MRSAVLAVLLVASSIASADTPKEQAASLFAEGQKHYAAGEYLVAADKFEAAFALDADPAYLFNVAQAYRFGNACAKAAAAYKKFAEAMPNAPNTDKVAQYRQQSEDCAKKQAASERPTPPQPDPPIVTPTPTPTPTPRGPESSDPGKGKRIAGLSIAAVGLVAFGVAGYYTYKAADYTSEREGLCAVEIAANRPCDWGGMAPGTSVSREEREQQLNDDGEAAELRARVSWAVGGVALIGGIALYLLGRETGSESHAVSVVPTRDGAMAFTTLSF